MYQNGRLLHTVEIYFFDSQYQFGNDNIKDLEVTFDKNLKFKVLEKISKAYPLIRIIKRSSELSFCIRQFLDAVSVCLILGSTCSCKSQH